MKILFVTFCLAYLVQINALEKSKLIESLDTVTNELLRAQNELSIAHNFSELQSYIDRNIIASYIELMNEQLIKSFMDTYEQMDDIEDEVEDILDEKPNSECVENARLRFELQVKRHGSFLANCMRSSHTVLASWITHTNNLTDTAQSTFNQVQNQGLASIVERLRIDSPDSFYDPINRRLRILLTSVRFYMNEFEEFRASLVENEEQILEDLTRCDRDLVERFRRAANFELDRARACE
ncbi:uncharacterized protein [Chironomus tepperi]|uniref:uncharacterized protein n=1 Tax=Chironomus tepperi TaxID=113505 RepID=UPI00391F213B